MSGAAKAAAVVKSNSYGLGIGQALPVLLEAGAREFFIARWNEIAGILRHVAPEQVGVFHGPRSAEHAAYARAAGVRPVINSLEQARHWIDAGGGACHLMVDTGINRLGIAMGQIGDPLLARLDIDILMSHLASADEDVALNAVQRARFGEACAAIAAKRRSLSNSAGIALGPDYAFDLTRPGVALYGGVPCPELAGTIRQVAYPQAAIIQVRELQSGDIVGYNAQFTAQAPMRVGVVSLGYADGFMRSWSARGALQYGEARLPLLGKVSMDMVVVDLAAAPQLAEGDWLDVPYYLPDAAIASGLSQYELLTVLGSRFTRQPAPSAG
ncbi:MAG: alanine racemase [Candidatus Andeanibacterium colombiense]|uniref:alanine racemase n=1 Tax=Candidatus Andeanibacterium colombiense TaxID=3121345 RepID=A0AAJ6BN20_9SPHN|nr:MAG: alanine racemase [Sphingomonadaceae bacterium]